VYSDPIFSSSGQWPRNALMQIVAIAPRCGVLPRRDRCTRFNPPSLRISLFLFDRSHPPFYPSTSLYLLYLSLPLALPKLIRPRESRDRRKSSRKFDCTRFATRALFFYAQRYMSIGKSRGTEAIVTNNAKIAFDTGFYDVVNWFALDRTVRPLSAGKLYPLFVMQY